MRTTKPAISHNWAKPLLICLLLILAITAVYYQVWTYDFVNYDDHEYVYKNPDIQAGITLKSIKWAFTTSHAANWHPLTWLSHMLDWRLFGSDAGAHHLTNLIFHIANTLLLFIVLKQMTNALWQSAFAAALFALHPLHVESVAWISERKDVLSAFFWMLTMWAYVRYARSKKIINYLLVTIFFAFGLMSKPMLVTLPFVLLLLDYWPLNRLNTKRSLLHLLFEKIPLFAMALASSVITLIVQEKGGALSTPTDYFHYRVANASISYLQYIIKMFWPNRLAFFYPHPAQGTSFLYAAISVAVLIIITILILRFAKNRRYLVTGWFWYLGTLVPVIGIIQAGSQGLADRYTYITLTGLFIIIAWGIPELFAKWRYKKAVLALSAILIILAMSICSRLQLRHWRNGQTLFQHALDVTKNNYVAHLCIAEPLYKQGKQDKAIYHLSQAIRFKPDYLAAINDLGIVLYKAGRFDEAISYYKRAIEINPRDVDGYINLGTALTAKGELTQAVKVYETVLNNLSQADRIKPDYLTAINDLGLALYGAGRINDAIDCYEKALKISYQTAEMHINLGTALAAKGELERAAKEYETALNIAPQNITARNNLGAILFRQGKFDRAAAEYKKSLQLNPNDPNILDALGLTLGRQNKLDEAIEYFNTALQINPGSVSAHTNFGYALAIQGKLDEAVVPFNRALEIDPNYAAAKNGLDFVLAEKRKSQNTNIEKTKR